MAVFGTSGELQFVLADEDRLEEALELQQRTMRHECVAVGVGMFEEPGAAEEMRLVFRQLAHEGLTLLGVDSVTGRLAAVTFNKIHARERPDPLSSFVERNVKHRACLDLIRFVNDVEASVDMFERFSADAALEIFYLGTDPAYRGRGVATAMVEASLRLGRAIQSGEVPLPGVPELTVKPTFAFGVFASAFSQRIVRKLGFLDLAERRYDEVTVGGKRMSDRIEEGDLHDRAVLAAIKL